MYQGYIEYICEIWDGRSLFCLYFYCLEPMATEHISLPLWQSFCRTNDTDGVQVRGYGLSADAHHITQPAPDGRGALLAMQRALSGSGVNTTDVAYINAHATSTPLGDAIEAAAIARMFQLSGEEVADQLLSQPKQQPVGQKGLLPAHA